MHKNLDSNKKILEFKKIFKTYDNDSVAQLCDVTFSISKNEFVCIVGPSGSSKSTILKIAAGIENKSAGSVSCDCNFSMVFQNGALLPWRTVSDNIAIALEASGLSGERIKEEVDKYLTMMKLKDFADKYPRNLSGGQRQRVGIARALAVKPELLLLDEPFSSLDEKTSAELHDDLIQICKEMNITVLMVTHQVEEAVSLADRVIVVAGGKILKEIPISIAHPRRDHEMEFMKKVNEIRAVLFVS